ncbi:hypothetical protein LSH36_852g01019 [Paralvinella palmiformis]|uniref:Uncharacterized protein n=1 Tax=Paralvinella palmiformis TaxID=53620 RepID=A0AAD9MTK6_9ANNE|nr:hypothetical protein LSH36_852g01019 [Paralvinella palmiformis]
MVWKVERVKRCAIGSTVVGLTGVVLLGISFGTTSWLTFPPGHFYLKTHSLFMGLFRDRACVNGQCGTVPETEMRTNTQTDWNIVLALMCTTLSVTLMAAAMNIVIIFMPKKVCTLSAGLFWCLAGVMNMLSVIIFWHLFEHYQHRMSWSYWLSMISTIIFYIIGFMLALFGCCHHWTTRSSIREPEDPIIVAPPPVVAYRSESEAGDGPRYDFTSDPDMQPYAFGGKPYSSTRSGVGGSHTYQI